MTLSYLTSNLIALCCSYEKDAASSATKAGSIRGFRNGVFCLVCSVTWKCSASSSSSSSRASPGKLLLGIGSSSSPSNASATLEYFLFKEGVSFSTILGDEPLWAIFAALSFKYFCTKASGMYSSGSHVGFWPRGHFPTQRTLKCRANSPLISMTLSSSNRFTSHTCSSSGCDFFFLPELPIFAAGVALFEGERR